MYIRFKKYNKYAKKALLKAFTSASLFEIPSIMNQIVSVRERFSRFKEYIDEEETIQEYSYRGFSAPKVRYGEPYHKYNFLCCDETGGMSS